MKPRHSREIRAVLPKKGFKKAENDHTYFFLHVDGKKTGVHTKVSHGSLEYGNSLLSLMAKRLCLTNGQLDKLLGCKIEGPEYVGILRSGGHLRSAPPPPGSAAGANLSPE